MAYPNIIIWLESNMQSYIWIIANKLVIAS